MSKIAAIPDPDSHPQQHDIDGPDHIGFPGGGTTFLRDDGTFAAPASVSDHGALTGLGDDDHPQYLLESLLDAKGDLIVASANDTPGRLPVGSNGQVLVADSTQALGAKWDTPASGVTDHGLLTGLGDDDHPQYVLESLLDAKGDLYVASANDTPGRLAVGSNDQVLVADSTQSLGVKWAAVPSGGSGGTTDSVRALGRASVSASPGASDDEFTDGSIDAAWTEVTPATDPGNFVERYNRMHYVHLAAPGGSRRLHALMRSKASGSIATGDYIESRIHYREHTNFGGAGVLAFADGTSVGSGDQVLLWIFGGPDTQNPTIEIQHISGYNTEVSRGTGVSVFLFEPVYVRLKYESANTWGAYYSYDGFNWLTITSSFSTTMTPTKMGFGCYFYDNQAPPSLSILNWMYFRYNPADE